MTHASDLAPLEIVRPPAGRHFRCALMDFDGTISLIRTGWQEVMAAMEAEALAGSPDAPDRSALAALIRADIDELTGWQTIYQMIRLAERVAQFGGRPAEPAEYKRRYNDLLLAHIADRRAALADGSIPPDELMLPGARRMLAALAAAGLKLYLASGTDEPYVVAEAELLGVTGYFAGGIHGARDDYRTYSKAKVIERMLVVDRIDGAALVGIGDGMVEIAETVRAGGYAVGVASDETSRGGQADEWKRRRLLAAGADMIVPDFARADEIAAALLGGKETRE